MNNNILQNTNQKNFSQLLYLRLIAIIGQVLVILFSYFILDISLPLIPMFVVVGVLVIINLIGFYRLKLQKNISDINLFIELLFDVFALSVQLYFSGGISNPFISLFLLQVIIGAVLLQARYAWLIALITIICYICLSFFQQDSHILHHHQGGDFFNLHLQGMLISYILAAILLLIFITKINKNFKERDQKINLLKQQSLEKEQIIKTGLLATSAAHELGTPLTTISVILADWKKMNVEKDLLEDVSLMESQITRCKTILSEILSVSGKERMEEAKLEPIKKSFDDLEQEFRKLRNPQNLIYNFDGSSKKKVILDKALIHSLFNILDNALEESPDFVLFDIKILENELTILVKDHGKGFAKNILQNIGTPNLSTKNSSGLGLFLAINTVERMGGKLSIKNQTQGAEVEIKIPLKNL